MARRSSSDTHRLKLWMVRQPQGLVPASLFDADALERYTLGAQLTCRIEQPRDDRVNRFFHALTAKVAKAIGEEPEALKWYLKLQAGLYKEVNCFDRSTSIVPRSLADLDQAEFKAFVDRAVEIIVTRIIPGADIGQLMADASSYMGERPQ